MERVPAVADSGGDDAGADVFVHALVSQRVGSTVLAQALEDTGIAGRPQEWLNVPGGELLSRYGAGDATELRDALWRQAVGPNGVLGIKYGMSSGHHQAVTATLSGLVDGRIDEAGRLAWAALLPNCKHVFSRAATRSASPSRGGARSRQTSGIAGRATGLLGRSSTSSATTTRSNTFSSRPASGRRRCRRCSTGGPSFLTRSSTRT
jgi:Stf0 sulphotransferase